MKIINRYLFGILCCFFPIIGIFAQQYPLTIIDYEDGLGKSSFYEVIKDPQGYLWMAGEGSVIRYDGTKFKHYSARDGISGHYVLDIDLDLNKNIWISTYGGGVASFDGNKFHSYNTSNGYPANYVRSTLITTTGEFWTASEDAGVVRKQPHKPPQILLNQNGIPFTNLWSLVESKNGDIWAAGVGGVICFQKTNNYQGKIILDVEYTMTSIAEDKEGSIWAGGAGYLVKINGDSITNCNYLLPANSVILDLHISKKSNIIYLATTTGLITIENDSITILDKTNGLKNEEFWDIYEDESNNIWLSSGGGGIIKNDNHGISIYNHQDNISFESTILDIVECKNGQLTFCTEANGCFYFENNKFMRFSDPQINDIRICYALIFDKRTSTTVFTNEKGEIFWMQNEVVVNKYQPGINKRNVIYDLAVLDNGQLLVLTDNGCYTLIPGSSDMVRIPKMPKVFCRSTFMDNTGASWILGDKGEIFKWYKGEVEILHQIINPNMYSLSDGYYDSYHDLFWFCTNGGLIVWNRKFSIIFHTNNGLNSDMPVSISQDKNHKIWIGHDHGLTGIDVENKSFNYLGYDQGFKTVVANKRSNFVASKGELFVGSLDNVYKIDIEAIAPRQKHTKLRLQEVSYQEKTFFYESYNQDSIPPLKLNYNENNLDIVLCALDFDDASAVKYSWMLKGYDNNFLPLTLTSVADYTNLPPGNYEFIAKAIDSEGFSTNVVRLKIIIESPFWEKIWFYILEILVLSLIVFLSILFSTKRSKNRLGQVMTFLTIIIAFESFIFYLSDRIDPITNGIPVFQLVMNIILAAILQPVEHFIRRTIKKSTFRKTKS